MLTILFLPIPPILIDLGLAFSIALSALILMVALWIQRPLDFSAFPTVLLIATILRLALNVATTRLILSRGGEGEHAAGYVVAGFSKFVMGGDFVIGLIIFAILVTVNFVVITKGATRIAEVGARFTLDAIPGKQMAIDADLSAGLIDDKEAQRRRRELEEESAFFGAMDGASKFVRGDAIAGLIITAINIFGGIIIGVTHHGLTLARGGRCLYQALRRRRAGFADSGADRLAFCRPAGLQGRHQGSAEQTVLKQLGGYPARAVRGGADDVRARADARAAAAAVRAARRRHGIHGLLAAEEAGGASCRKRSAQQGRRAGAGRGQGNDQGIAEDRGDRALLGSQLAVHMLGSRNELAHRVSKIRKKFAKQYGFVIPEIKLTDDLSIDPKGYQIKIHDTRVAHVSFASARCSCCVDEDRKPDVPGDEVIEPAFGMKAMWVTEAFTEEVKRQGFKPVDNLSVLLTHLSEVIRANLAQLLSYKDMRALLDRLDPEYKRLIDDLCPSQISYSGLLAILKILLAERVSIRNLHLILEAIAEIAPHVRRSEQVAEHVRMRIAQQICGDLSDNGVLNVVRLGNRWDLAFHQSLKRDAKGEVVEFDADPRLIEQFATEASAAVRKFTEAGTSVVLAVTPEARPYVRMILERVFPTLPILSHVEVARSAEIRSLGAVS